MQGRQAGSDYGLELLEGLTVQIFLNSAFLCASWGRTCTCRPAFARRMGLTTRKARH